MNENLEQALRQNLKRRKRQQLNLTNGASRQNQEELAIQGGGALNGEITISGAKNAALPMMVASLLSDQKIRLTHLPHLSDVHILANLLKALGCQIIFSPETQSITMHAPQLSTYKAPLKWVQQIRASFWVTAPLIARIGQADVPLPGGDAIGKRAINIYLDAFKHFGAEIEESSDSVYIKAPALTGNRFHMPFPSVGATHVALMMAVCAKGESEIINAAREPEISALAFMLTQMGAHIEGAGSHTIRVQGGAQLHKADIAIPPDRIEAGTYAIAAAIASGYCVIKKAPISQLSSLLDLFTQAEIPFRHHQDALIIHREPNQPIKPIKIATAPYPDFPTDLQAQLMALMTQADGISHITETIFENRFQHVGELNRLGAKIRLEGRSAHIEGKSPLYGATISATDIRASASLIIAALVAQGVTRIQNIYHLDRGFETMEYKLQQCGALIERC